MLTQDIRYLTYRIPSILFLVAIALTFGLLLVAYGVISLGAFIIVSGGILFLIAPRVSLLLLLLIRPTMDIFSSYGIRFGPVAILNVNAVLAFFVIVVGFLFFLIYRYNFLSNTVSKIFLSFLVITFFWGVFVSQNLMNFFAVFSRELSCFIVFCLATYLFREIKHIRKLAVVSIISGAVPLCVAYYQVVRQGFRLPLSLFPAESVRVAAVGGAIRSAPELAVWLMLALMISVGFLLTRNKGSSILKWGILSIFLYVSLIFTYFRTAWAGILFAILVISIMRYRKLLIAFVSAVFISLFVMPSILQRLPAFSSWYWRTRLWERIILSVREDILGFLMGRGFGSISVLLRDMWEMDVTTAHNTYIETFFQTGLIGITLYLLMRLIILKKAYSLLRLPLSRDVKALLTGVFGMTIALFVAYIAQTITGPAVMWYYWAFAGALFGIERSLKEESIRTLD